MAPHVNGVAQRMLAPTVNKQSCDECRRRKIRCDRLVPCSHCRASKLVCHTSPRKARETKSSSGITKHCENKIGLLESRIASLEQSLQHAVGIRSPPSTQSSPQAESASAKITSPLSMFDTVMDDTTGTSYTGQRADSMAARQAVEQTVESNLLMRSDPQLNSALSSLASIIDKLKVDGLHTTESSASVIEEPELPTWDQVAPVLAKVTWHNLPLFMKLGTTTSRNTVGEFVQRCGRIYQNLQNAPWTERLLVLATLFYMYTEFSQLDTGAAADQYHNLAGAFAVHLLKASVNIPMFASPSFETIEALLSGASVAINMCKPSLSWDMLAVAARHCQKLGYNRISAANAETDVRHHRKVMLFWITYVQDRIVSLRLGRAPLFQDYDISVPRLTPCEDFPEGIVHLMNHWVDVAMVQGKACVWLYSPAGVTLSYEQRLDRVDALTQNLHQSYNDRLEANDSILAVLVGEHVQSNSNSSNPDLIMAADAAAYYSTQTLLLHASQGSGPISSVTVEAARACLRTTTNIDQSPIGNAYSWAFYCHWVLLHNPLTPFTLLFCHIIADPSTAKDDLKLMSDFVTSLQTASSLSDGIDKFRQLCLVLWKVAQAYKDAKDNESLRAARINNGSTSVSDESPRPTQIDFGNFDSSLSDLNLFPQPNAGTQPDYFSNPDFGMTGYLQNWFSCNISMYGLLDEEMTGVETTETDPTASWSLGGSSEWVS